jgi:hypothetical protein
VIRKLGLSHWQRLQARVLRDVVAAARDNVAQQRATLMSELLMINMRLKDKDDDAAMGPAATAAAATTIVPGCALGSSNSPVRAPVDSSTQADCHDAVARVCSSKVGPGASTGAEVEVPAAASQDAAHAAVHKGAGALMLEASLMRHLDAMLAKDRCVILFQSISSKHLPEYL